MPEPLPFLLLKLRSCDDLDDIKFTFDGTTGEKTPLRVDLRMAYNEEVAALPKYHRMGLTIGGFSRTFVVLSVEPVADGKDILTFYPEPGKPPVRPTMDSVVHSWVGEFKASPSLNKDIERLMDFMERTSTTQSLAYGAAARTSN